MTTDTQTPMVEDQKPTEAPAAEAPAAEAPAAEEQKPTEAPAAEEQKPTEAPAAEEQKPTKPEWTPYELQVENANPEQLKVFNEFSNELKIPQERAMEFAQKFNTAQAEQIQQTFAQWADEARADKEIGGDKFDESVATAKKALKKFGGDEVLSVLDETGLGNHKAIIRAWCKVGQAMADDKVMQGGGAPQSEPVSFKASLLAVANQNKQQ